MNQLYRYRIGVGARSMKSEKKKMEKELEQIKRMQSINDIIDRGSSENTLLYTSSRENESIGDDAIDNMLNRMAGKENEREIRMVEGIGKVSASRRERGRSGATARRAHHARPARHKKPINNSKHPHRATRSRAAPKRSARSKPRRRR